MTESSHEHRSRSLLLVALLALVCAGVVVWGLDASAPTELASPTRDGAGATADSVPVIGATNDGGDASARSRRGDSATPTNSAREAVDVAAVGPLDPAVAEEVARSFEGSTRSEAKWADDVLAAGGPDPNVVAIRVARARMASVRCATAAALIRQGKYAFVPFGEGRPSQAPDSDSVSSSVIGGTVHVDVPRTHPMYREAYEAGHAAIRAAVDAMVAEFNAQPEAERKRRIEAHVSATRQIEEIRKRGGNARQKAAQIKALSASLLPNELDFSVATWSVSRG